MFRMGENKILIFLVLAVIVNAVLAQTSYGYGCREANLPNAKKLDCHPEQGANEEECRKRNCVWCDEGEVNEGYPFCFYRDPNYEPPGSTCDVGYVQASERVDCNPDNLPMNEMECRYRNCTWCPYAPDGVTPWCFQSASIDSTGYSILSVDETTAGVRITLGKSFKGVKPQWENEAQTLIMDAEFQSNERLRIKITDGTPRFEVPIEIGEATGGNTNLLYEVRVVDNPTFSFQVVRRSNGAVLFDSSAGKLTFADQFLQMSWKLPSENFYGIGENEQRSFKHNFNEKLNLALFATDSAPLFTAPIYGTHPHYTVLENNGLAHAVAIVNSNYQEFDMLPGPMVKYTTIGGIFDMYFFLGPTPEDTVRQYTEAVGKSQMPPYWGLGFQLCRWGYDSLNGDGGMKEAVDRMEQYQIPQDVQYGDIDIMRDELDFTYDMVNFSGLPEYVLELKERGIKFVTILDPFISIIEEDDYRPFTLGQEMDVWYKKANGDPVKGIVWPHDATAPVYFPDYSKTETQEWWRILVKDFHDLLAYDGLWIDMNEPANFEHGDLDDGCANNEINYPPYKPGMPGQVMMTKTLCPDHVDSVSTHYNTHSLYGWFESKPTLEGLREGTGKRGMVLSRSTFLGSGKWTSHWLGDNWSHWSNLHYSIIGVMQFNLWGIPYVGPDICGFLGNSNAALCQRWQELGAFYPFSRNHNVRDSIPQDPGVWGEEVAMSTKKALEVRYTMLPYLYTLFFKHVTTGSTVFRPLWYNYADDSTTYGIDRQFMWGTGLLVTPVLDLGAVNVDGYFPDQRHYSYYTGEEVATRKATTNLNAPLDFIPVHVVGGNIIPTQEPAKNTMLARENPMGLIIALNDEGMSEGELFYDDGESIETHFTGDFLHMKYTFDGNTLTSIVETDGYPAMAMKNLTTIRLLGHEGVTSITVNGVAHTAFETLESGEVLVTELSLIANDIFNIVFA